MPERVVDLLELVEVDEVNRAHAVGPALGERLVHAAAQDGAVGQAGERVEPRELIDSRLRRLAFRAARYCAQGTRKCS